MDAALSAMPGDSVSSVAFIAHADQKIPIGATTQSHPAIFFQGLTSTSSFANLPSPGSFVLGWQVLHWRPAPHRQGVRLAALMKRHGSAPLSLAILAMD